MGVRREDLAAVRPEVMKELRSRARLSQLHLAGLSGVSNATVSRIENGTQVPSHETLENLVRAMAGYADWDFDQVLQVAYGKRTTWSVVTPIMNRMERLSRPD